MKAFPKQSLLIILLMISLTLNETIYVDIIPYNSYQIEWDPTIIQHSFLFKGRIGSDNIIQIKPIVDGEKIFPKVTITIHEGKSIEDDPAGVPIWSSIDITSELPEYIFQLTSDTNCYVKIVLVDTEIPMEFNLAMFNELDQRVLVTQNEISIEKFYSKNKALFSIIKRNYYVYFSFIITTSDGIPLKAQLIGSTSELPLKTVTGIVDTSKFDRMEESESILTYTIQLEPEDLSKTKGNFKVAINEINSYSFTELKNGSPLNFNNELKILKFFAIEQYATAETDLIYSLTISGDNTIIVDKEDLKLHTIITQVTEVVDLMIYPKETLLTKVDLKEINKRHYNYYFRFPKGEASKQTVIMFYIEISSKLIDLQIIMTLVKPMKWELHSSSSLINSNEIELAQSSTALIQITNRNLAKTFILACSDNIQRVYLGPIVTKGEEDKVIIQEPTHAQIFMIPANSGEITIEINDSSNQSKKIIFQLEAIEQPDKIIYRYNARNSYEKTRFICNGKANEIYMIEVQSTIDTIPHWMSIERLYGNHISYVIETLELNPNNPTTIFPDDSYKPTDGVHRLRTAFYIARITCQENKLGMLEHAVLNNLLEINADKLKENEIILIPAKTTTVKFDKETNGVNIEIRIIDVNKSSEVDKGTITITYDNDTPVVIPIGYYNTLRQYNYKQSSFTMTSTHHVAVLIIVTLPNIFTELLPFKDQSQDIETHLLTASHLIYKFTNIDLLSYTIAFDKDISTTINYSIGTSINDFIPIPSNEVNGIKANMNILSLYNPYLMYASELNENEFYYFSLKIDKDLVNKVSLKITKNKQSISFEGEVLLNNIKKIDKDYKYQLEYSHDKKLKKMVMFVVFNYNVAESSDKPKISLNYYGGLIVKDVTKQKEIICIDRLMMSYYASFNIATPTPTPSANDAATKNMYMSIAYMTEEQITTIPDFTKQYSFEEKNSTKIIWEKPTEAISSYYIFIKKKNDNETYIAKDEYTLYEEKDSAIKINGDALLFTFTEKNYMDGTYIVDILAINEEGLKYFFAFNRKEVEIKHPKKTPKDMFWLWISLLIIASVMVIIVLVLICRRRCNKSGGNTNLVDVTPLVPDNGISLDTSA